MLWSTQKWLSFCTYYWNLFSEVDVLKKNLCTLKHRGKKKKAAQSYSPTLKSAVPLPQTGLTSEFGMGSGISPSQSAQPKLNFSKPHTYFVAVSLMYRLWRNVHIASRVSSERIFEKFKKNLITQLKIGQEE